MTKRICIGAFAGAHGVKGEAKVKSFTETEDGVARYGAAESENGERRFSFKFIRVLKPGLALVSAPEIKNREDAAALAGTRLYIGRDRLPPPVDDEFYIEDLVGLEAEDETAASLGRVAAAYNFGAGDVIELSGVPGVRPPVMIPFARDTVPKVDIAGGKIVVASAALTEITAEAAVDETLVEEAMRQEDA
jgi:16S rRNA processing protein RimM